MKSSDKKQVQNILFWFVLITLIGSIIYIVVSIINAPLEPGGNRRIKSEYILMLLQCLLGVVAMFLPSFLSRKFSLIIPSGMFVLYVAFLYAAIYLGEVRNFYYHIPFWDTILHTLSGVVLGALGFSFVNILNNNDRVPINLSPAFVTFFAFCFAVTMGVLWEFYEFTFDGFMDLNMQKYKLENGNELLGRAALTDTVKDLIVDSIGAAAICILGHISIKLKKNWMEKFTLKTEKSSAS